jgi:hypothetical protein
VIDASDTLARNHAASGATCCSERFINSIVTVPDPEPSAGVLNAFDEMTALSFPAASR